MNCKRRLFALPILVVLAVSALALAPDASLAKPGKSAVRTFQGTVSAVGSGHHSIRIKRSRGASVRIRVRRSTKLARGVRLRRGQSIRVKTRRTRRGWVAVRIVRSHVHSDETTSEDDVSGGDDDETAADEVNDDDPAGADLPDDLEDSADALDPADPLNDLPDDVVPDDASGD